MVDHVSKIYKASATLNPQKWVQRGEIVVLLTHFLTFIAPPVKCDIFTFERIEVSNRACLNKNKDFLEPLQHSKQIYKAWFFIFDLVFFRFKHVKLAVFEYFWFNGWKLQIKTKQKQNWKIAPYIFVWTFARFLKLYLSLF